ncbi:DUF928 domain-containing protein [Lusitaniella coriacea]|uniref:DUF928 domain-containing protein n=1 Tax=Lusitaniella coriacea TaxID=1983105 RepID=UPI003CF4A9C1
MNYHSSFQSLAAIAGFILPIFSTSASLQPQAVAQMQSPPQVSVNFPQSGSAGSTPSRTAGGGVRGSGSSCVTKGKDAVPLTVLMPTSNVGTTFQSDPKLFVSIPKTTAIVAEVAILDEDFNEIYVESDFPLPEQLAQNPGIAQFDLKGANLQPNQTYIWTFALICDSRDRSRDILVEGQFQRLELDSESKAEIGQKTTLEQAKFYASQGVWIETIDLLSALRQSHPEEWNELLNSVGLEELTPMPFVE